MKRLKRIAGIGLAVGLAASAFGVLGASPADATVKVGQINCTANIPALASSVALQQPSTSHLTGPYWVSQGAAFAVTNVGGATILPSAANGIGINSFQDVITKAMIIGQPTTTVSTTPTLVGGYANDGFFYFDDDINTPGDAVKMDGLAGRPAAPTVVIAPITVPSPVPGTYQITTTLDPGAGILDIADGPAGGGGAVYAPNVVIGVTNAGATDGPINWIGTQTSLTAKILGVIDAITTCAPPADPAYTAHVQTDGTAPGTPQEPVVACDPANNTPGTYKDAKGFSTTGGAKPLPPNSAGAPQVTTTFSGCIAPDQQSNAWNASKNGPLAADAVTLTAASIAIKGKNFGNCTLVDIRQGGETANADSDAAYESYTVATIKWLNGAAKPVKGASTTSASMYSRFVINLNSYTPLVTTEHNGVVTKGFGAGGMIQIVAEMDTANAQVGAIVDCNTGGPNSFPGTYLAKNGLPIKTADNAVLEIQIP